MHEKCLHVSGFYPNEPVHCQHDALPEKDYCAAHADEELTFDQIIREGKQMEDHD